MAYTTVAAVQLLFPTETFDGSSPVTTAAITNTFIPQMDAYIDGRLRAVYTVPITDADDLLIIGHIAALLVAGLIQDILYAAQGAPERMVPVENAENFNPRRFSREAEAWLKLLVTDGGKAGSITLNAGRNLVTYGGLYESVDPVDGVGEPVFTMRQVF